MKLKAQVSVHEDALHTKPVVSRNRLKTRETPKSTGNAPGFQALLHSAFHERAARPTRHAGTQAERSFDADRNKSTERPKRNASEDRRSPWEAVDSESTTRHEPERAQSVRMDGYPHEPYLSGDADEPGSPDVGVEGGAAGDVGTEGAATGTVNGATSPNERGALAGPAAPGASASRPLQTVLTGQPFVDQPGVPTAEGTPTPKPAQAAGADAAHGEALADGEASDPGHAAAAAPTTYRATQGSAPAAGVVQPGSTDALGSSTATALQESAPSVDVSTVSKHSAEPPPSEADAPADQSNGQTGQQSQGQAEGEGGARQENRSQNGTGQNNAGVTFNGTAGASGTAANAPTTSAQASSPVERPLTSADLKLIADSIGQAVRANASAGGASGQQAAAAQMTVQVQHPTLGSVRVAMQLQNGTLDLRFMMASSVAADKLRASETGLRRSLGQHGMQLRDVRVSLNDKHGRGASGGRGRRGGSLDMEV